MSNKTNLIVDIIAFIVFLVAYETRLTGIPIHEWLSMALFAWIVLHLALHWKWVAQITLKFFRQLFHSSRLNYVINALFFICFIGVMLSGLLISRSVMPFLGIDPGHDMIWRVFHTVTANGSIILLGAHFALHWGWVWKMLKKYIFSPVGRLFKRNKLAPQSAAPAAALPPTKK